MAQHPTLHVYLRATDRGALYVALAGVSDDVTREGPATSRSAVGHGYSYHITVGGWHELSERAASVLGHASIGSPMGDLAAALDEVERLRGLLQDIHETVNGGEGDPERLPEILAVVLRNHGGPRG